MGAFFVPEITPEIVPERHAHGRSETVPVDYLVLANMRILLAAASACCGCRDGSVGLGPSQESVEWTTLRPLATGSGGGARRST